MVWLGALIPTMATMAMERLVRMVYAVAVPRSPMKQRVWRQPHHSRS